MDSYPYLGITVSSDLRWHKHVSCTAAKATRTLNFVRRNIYSCTKEAKQLAYVSLVRPLLEYGAAAWDPHTQKDIKILEGVQKRAARFVFRDYRQTTSASGLVNDLGWLPLSDRRRNARLIQFHKAVHNLSLISVSGLQQPSRCTRSSSSGMTFIPLQARTDALKFSFMHRTLIDWNSLPAANRTIVPALSFKNALLSPIKPPSPQKNS